MASSIRTVLLLLFSPPPPSLLVSLKKSSVEADFEFVPEVDGLEVPALVANDGFLKLVAVVLTLGVEFIRLNGCFLPGRLGEDFERVLRLF